jgi:hypothetical protein
MVKLVKFGENLFALGSDPISGLTVVIHAYQLYSATLDQKTKDLLRSVSIK